MIITVGFRISFDHNIMTSQVNDSIAIGALAADLLFTSKIKGAATAAGVAIHMARNATGLLEFAQTHQPKLLLVDLDTRGLDISGVIQGLRAAAPGATVLAYVSHVRTEAIREAQQAGAKVLARSAFTSTLPVILQSAGT